MNKISINSTTTGTPFKPFWNTCIGAGRACEGLRTDWQEQLKMTVQECGFQYIRFHGLLCDDMGIYQVLDGVEHYNFAYVDMLFDRLLKTGIRPFVEFGFMPAAMASGSSTQFWWLANVTPPKDYDAWTRLLTNLIRHWLERYGEEEVLHWYFEIWNEANLHAFWDGTKSEYFMLYEVSVKAIKALHPHLLVGGPATSNFVPDERFSGEKENLELHKTHLVEDLNILEWKGVWLEDFLAFCAARQLPLDFISTHPYPTDFALDGQDSPGEAAEMKGRSRSVTSTKEDLSWLKNLLKKSPYADIEIHLTEWSSSPTSRDYSHDYLPAAAYVIKSTLDCIGLADSLSYWVFTDIFEEAGPGPEAFHGGFGLLNVHGIKKPTYHAYHFLNQLGHVRISQGDNYILTKDQRGKLKGLFYHYPAEMKSAVPISAYPNHVLAEKVQSTGTLLTLSFDIRGLTPQAALMLQRLDEDHGNVTSLWKEYDYPKNLTAGQRDALKTYAESFKTEVIAADHQGNLNLELNMSPWSIIFLSEQ